MNNSKESTDHAHQPFLIICIGVSGCGKSTLAAKLARHYGAEFMEADNFHSQENKQHMASGKPLTDEMRRPWIKTMCDHLMQLQKQKKNCVMAYSGLRREHRNAFRKLGFKMGFILLEGSKTLIAKRLRSRKGHFMPADLISSQFAAFEPPINEPDIIALPINQPVSNILQAAKECVDAQILA